LVRTLVSDVTLLAEPNMSKGPHQRRHDEIVVACRMKVQQHTD
jgi:hypothetical protein